MKKVKIYTGDKTMMFPSGAMASPETVLEQFPAILEFPHIIETDEMEQVIFAVQNLSSARGMHNVPAELSDGEAAEFIETILNAPAPEEAPSAQERIAAALEFQNLIAL